jgi:hypothetical protein
MVKKFLVLASETIIYREEIEADDEAQAKDLFKQFHKVGTVFANNSDELDIYSVEELKE